MSPPTKRAGAAGHRSVLWRWRRSLFLVGLVALAGLAGAGFVLAQIELPEEDPLLQSTFICAADVTDACGPENAIANLAGEQDRVSLALEEIPQVLIDAVLAAEDRHFFEHPGVDPIGIVRALYRDLRNEGVQQGGSTITQQYVKNAYLTSERTVTRKLKEAVLAIKLERELPKEEILRRYLNTVYFGRGAYGVEAASRAYFGHPVRTIDLAEAAYLAGLIRAPESADASRDPEVAQFRRDSVLEGMRSESMIGQAEHDSAVARPIETMVADRTVRQGLGDVVGRDYGTEYFVEYIRLWLTERFGGDVVRGGGLRVYTTLDLDLQRAAFEAVTGVLDAPDTDPDAALVSVDDAGHVVALVGGRDFEASELNLGLAPGVGPIDLGGTGRQPGSSFKPVVLAEAIRQGASVHSKFEAPAKAVFPKADNGDDWTVRNYGNAELGVLDLVEATRVSSNTAYAQLMLEVGAGNVASLAKELGVGTELEPVNALVLGAGEVSVLDMANAYSTFMRRGLAIEPIFVTRVEQVVDGEVVVLEEASTKSEQVLDETDADLVTWVLRQVVTGGTGTGANPGVPAAGKTGTTQDNRDAWFVGYTPRLTTAVWMGFADLTADGNTRFMDDVRGRSVTGGSFPAEIWKRFMVAALDGRDHGNFVAPTDFGSELLNPDLTTTSSSLPPCGPPSSVAEGESPPETEPCETTTTTTTTEPDSSSTSAPDATTTTGPTTTTTTTEPPPTTTTTAPESTSTSLDIGD